MDPDPPNRRSVPAGRGAMAFMTLPEATRVAMPLASAGNRGYPHPSRQATRRACAAATPRPVRERLAHTRKTCRSTLPRARRPLDRLEKMRAHRLRNVETAAPPASPGSPSSSAPLPRPAANRAPRTCPVCAASQTQDGCAAESATVAAFQRVRCAAPARSLPGRCRPSTACVCQPYASKRRAQSSVKVIAVPAESVT